MTVESPPAPQQPLQKPPGYRDPNGPIKSPFQPPKPVKLPPSFHPKRRRSCLSCRVICCTICTVTALLLLVLISLCTFFYVWYQPRLPEIHVKSIDFAKFNVSTSQDGPVLNSQTRVYVEVKNSNEYLKMEYGKIRILLTALNGEVSFGQRIFPGFTQERSNFTTLKAVMNVKDEILENKSAVNLKNGFKGKSMAVRAEVKTGIGVKGSGLVHIVAMCDNMRLSQLRDNGEMPKCRVKLLNLIYLN